MMRGAFVDKHWMFISLSGLIYLGIGDTVAALGGKYWGQSRWSVYSKKTIDGSFYMILALFGSYFILALTLHPIYINFVRQF